MRHINLINLGLAILLLESLFLTVARSAEGPVVPKPGQQVVDLLSSGRTYRAIRVDVVKVGQALPETFAGIPLSNTDGFSWFVSRHFALKTDVEDSRAQYLLEVLECAYPYYVKFFGAEPKGIDHKRLAVVYATQKNSLESALASDNIKWNFGGGGITFDRVQVSYAYRGENSTNYHERYIVIHECVHLYQMCLTIGTTDNTPKWFYEGIADCISTHAFDEPLKRLTLSVLDQGMFDNFLEDGLTSLRHHPVTIREIDSADTRTVFDRGVAFVLVNFLRSTPERDRRFHRWCSEIMQMPLGNERDPAVRAEREARLEKLYGPLDLLEVDFAEWWKARQNTFHAVQWGWEQYGDMFQAYGFADDGKLSQMDLLLTPGARPRDDPWRMDYPVDPVAPTIGEIGRGTAEPSIGAVLDFSADKGTGIAGIGLGVLSPAVDPATGLSADRPSQLKILVHDATTLEIDGSELSLKAISFPIPDDVKAAMKADGLRIGMTIQIARDGLRVTLRGKDPASDAMPAFTATLPIDSKVRQRLLTSRVSLLARGGWQRITPFFDAGPRPRADSLPVRVQPHPHSPVQPLPPKTKVNKAVQ